jgi:hypothetical protein
MPTQQQTPQQQVQAAATPNARVQPTQQRQRPLKQQPRSQQLQQKMMM